MYLLAVFLATLILITLVTVRYRVSPFFTLTAGAFFFGILAGMSPDAVITDIAKGMGNTFFALGIIIFSGSVIAKVIQVQGQTKNIVDDLKRLVKNPPALSGVAGYLLALPITCCITAYIMIIPIIENLEKNRQRRNILFYITATASVVSYVLIYPSPVVFPLFNAFSGAISPLLYDAAALSISLALLAGIIFAGRRHFGENTLDPATESDSNKKQYKGPKKVSFHIKAWIPFIVILIALPAGYFLLDLSHHAMINFAMISAAASAVILTPKKLRSGAINQGSKHAGIIIFDICGAGGLGYVIIKSGIAEEAMASYPAFLPAVFLPFLIAALIETAQGSRLVTAIVSAEIIAQTRIPGMINPISLILLISAGTCFISFVTDPYFWIVKQTTGDDHKTVLKNYTLPLALSGIAILAFAYFIEYFLYA